MKQVLKKKEKISADNDLDSSTSRKPHSSGRGKEESLGVNPEQAPPFMAGNVEWVDRPRSVFEHLEEIRNRIIFCLFLIAVCSALTYSFIPRIMALIIRSVGKLYFMAPTEAFWVQVKLALFIGFYCALPFIFYQVWRFVEIGLKQNEKRFILPLALGSFVLFTLGGSFCYVFVIPVAVKFLLSYGSETLVPLISVSKYISFIVCLVLAFGFTFQLPLILMFLARIGMVTSRILRNYRRFAVLGSFVIGAALTPTPDMVNQTLLAVPLIVLYELSIWLIRIFEHKALNENEAL
ncbi:MAG: twin-arginine translocase subunit TatC [Candidatus Omnitrophica bacterium]|nr:twin-arginine translocase subunit TatC [Candidatus Omnitrophota bacterium]MBU4479109.1 twin-arginine translocase subunit TatC [Candidatus Omnitrophota bacterium]MCG2703414.1 twin-arginine translocase subunit TatC [Candidatus Omnitrophota bacterium]